MKQWFLNLMRRLDNWEAGMGQSLDRFELTYVDMEHTETSIEVTNLDRTQQVKRDNFDREQALELDNFLASQQIERIEKQRRLANLAHRKAELESRVGTQAESKADNRVTWG